MKRQIAILGVMILGVGTGWLDTSLAQTSNAQLPPPPPGIAYYSLAHELAKEPWPPFPFIPFPDLKLIQVDKSTYFFNDLDIDWDKIGAEAAAQQAEEAAIQMLLGGGSYGLMEFFDPQGLWLQITNVDSTYADILFHNTSAGYWELLLTRTNLNEASWRPELLVAATNNLTVFHDALLGRTNLFYFAAQASNAVQVTADLFHAAEPGPATTNPLAFPATFTLTRTNVADSYDEDLTVVYRLSGTASNGMDYTTLTGTVTIPAYSATATLLVEPLADFLLEVDETVTLTLVTTNDYVPVPGGESATIVIEDNVFDVAAYVNAPIGLDYYAPSNALVASVNYTLSSFPPYNFALIQSNGVVPYWGGIQYMLGEIKLATVKTTNTFAQGEMYYGTTAFGNPVVGKLSANGTTNHANWVPLTNEANALRGSLYVDQTGLFGYDLIVVAGNSSPGLGNKGVWRIGSNAEPHLVTNIYTQHLEGVITLPNDTNQWGPWAGKIITGDEAARDTNQDLRPLIYAIATNGAYTSYALGIHPEDFDLVPTNQDLYITSPSYGGIFKLPKTFLTNYVGDLMITDAGEFAERARFNFVHWSGSVTNFVTNSIALPTWLGAAEHVTFAPIDIRPQY